MLRLRSLFALLQAGAPDDGAAGAMWQEGVGAASPFGMAPVILLGGPVVVAVVLIWLYARTARQHRRAQMAPPVWLLPYLERPADAGPDWRPAGPDPDHAELEDVRLESAARLARRKRALLVGLGLNFVAGWAAAAVYLYNGSRSVEFQDLPESMALGASVDTAAFMGIEGRSELEAEVPPPTRQPPPPPPQAAPATVAAPNPAPARPNREPPALSARQRDSLAQVRRQDSLAVAAAVAQRVRDSVTRALRDSIALAQATAAAEPVPAPPPPPPAPPPRDPAVERARAGSVLRARAQGLVSAINRRDGLAGLIEAGPTRERFIRFVQEQQPSATIGSLAEPTLAAERAETVLTIQFQWRGPFGDTRRREGRFRMEAELIDGSWRVERLVPLDIPQ